MSSSTVAHDTFVIERTYDLAVPLVFKAWSDPATKARWFTGTEWADRTNYEMDFQVGGHEINRAGPPGGPIYTYDAVYRDIVADHRIVYTYEMHAGEDRISVSVATIEFIDEGDSTRLILTEQGVFLDGHDTSAQREEGTASLLDQLGAELARAAA
jgi:uncharacterized protein YndB with AHSA1/START domain